ncbi:hypothetical protein AVEN_213253-1 [Araneus ventricosus]|uniref:Ig-like domain-containing protein n=1 Tax=Araneus ventricosus TaxID=182803 RepID=A0A4Y2DDN0_ARAVE|nr:hypothetical protein AVEN_213253-1 [Araneus ventricosus]
MTTNNHQLVRPMVTANDATLIISKGYGNSCHERWIQSRVAVGGLQCLLCIMQLLLDQIRCILLATLSAYSYPPVKPLSVRITTEPKPLKVGDDLRLDCQTFGSRPKAKIVWWIDNKLIQNEKQSFFIQSSGRINGPERNVTYSSIHLSPGIDDNGKVVICKAENPALPHSDIQDSWTLNIHFPPEVSLQLGANIKYSTIKEGNDVYLECVIRANPPVSELTWFFEGVPFYGNSSAGVIISNQSLVLQKVRKEHRGNYKCLAANTEGQGQSLELLLEVRYAPTCKASQKNLYGVARGEDVNITCEVEADPREVSFRWALNNSVENVELYNFTSKGTRSVLTFTPRTMLEFGAVLCWGQNVVGMQKEPCVARIIPAGEYTLAMRVTLITLSNLS